MLVAAKEYLRFLPPPGVGSGDPPPTTVSRDGTDDPTGSAERV
jgi:hypothetical protein